MTVNHLKVNRWRVLLIFPSCVFLPAVTYGGCDNKRILTAAVVTAGGREGKISNPPSRAECREVVDGRGGRSLFIFTL